MSLTIRLLSSRTILAVDVQFSWFRFWGFKFNLSVDQIRFDLNDVGGVVVSKYSRPYVYACARPRYDDGGMNS